MAGEGGKFLAVNVDEDALVYVDAPAGGGGVPADESLENKQMKTVDADYAGIHASKLDMDSIAEALGPIKKDTYHALGDIVSTPLSYAEFLGSSGDDSWVPLDGRDISGSDLQKVTGMQNLPNIQGFSAFLRTHGDNTADVGIIADDQTGKSFQFSFDELNLQNYNHEHMTMYLGVGDVVSNESKQSVIATQSTDTSELAGVQRYRLKKSFDGNQVLRYNTDAHTTDYQYNFKDWNIAISGSGNETRPKNVAVNYFIKINR